MEVFLRARLRASTVQLEGTRLVGELRQADQLRVTTRLLAVRPLLLIDGLCRGEVGW